MLKLKNSRSVVHTTSGEQLLLNIFIATELWTRYFFNMVIIIFIFIVMIIVFLFKCRTLKASMGWGVCICKFSSSLPCFLSRVAICCDLIFGVVGSTLAKAPVITTVGIGYY